jgi:hypothetical protein
MLLMRPAARVSALAHSSTKRDDGAGVPMHRSCLFPRQRGDLARKSAVGLLAVVRWSRYFNSSFNGAVSRITREQSEILA